MPLCMGVLSRYPRGSVFSSAVSRTSTQSFRLKISHNLDRRFYRVRVDLSVIPDQNTVSIPRRILDIVKFASIGTLALFFIAEDHA
jgi:hypothetical protein